MLIEQLVNATGIEKSTGFDFQSLTNQYNRFALILTDIVSMTTNQNIPFPMPLVGFLCNYNSDVPFISNEYSEYPYLNKQLLVEGAISQNPDFSLLLHNVITSANPYTAKELTNFLFVDGLYYYVKQGGTFAVLSPWGNIDLCVLVGLYGITNDAGQKGITYRVDLKKLTPVRSVGETLAYKVASYITGAIL